MANPKTILPVKPGTLTPEDKRKLKRHGIEVIEHEDPASLRPLHAALCIPAETLLGHAMDALFNTKLQSREAALHSFNKGVRRDVFKSLGIKNGVRTDEERGI